MEVQDMTKAYALSSKQDWKGFKRFYEENAAKKPLLTALNVDGDNAFHIAAASGNLKLLQGLLAMQPPNQLHEALEKSNHHKNTPLHHAATSDCAAAAKLLIDAAGMRRRKYETLRIRNKLGETALYTAAACGKTSMVQYLVKEIEDLAKSIYHLEEDEILEHLRYHFCRDIDKISILHMAVLGQHFDTAIWLLRKDKELANKRENNNMTCLQLLALMPRTFFSTCELSKFQRVVYSLTSVVMFLSILTSPFQKQNFLYSLPRKLTIGFFFLFLSVVTTMITFTASVLLTVRLGRNWSSSAFYAAAFIPVTIFALINFPWYAPFVRIFIRFTKVFPARTKKSV